MLKLAGPRFALHRVLQKRAQLAQRDPLGHLTANSAPTALNLNLSTRALSGKPQTGELGRVVGSRMSGRKVGGNIHKSAATMDTLKNYGTKAMDTAKNYGTKAMDTLRSDPTYSGAAIGAAGGMLLGLLRKPRRGGSRILNALLGGLGGGALGAGAGYGYGRYQDYQTAKSNAEQLARMDAAKERHASAPAPSFSPAEDKLPAALQPESPEMSIPISYDDTGAEAKITDLGSVAPTAPAASDTATDVGLISAFAPGAAREASLRARALSEVNSLREDGPKRDTAFLADQARRSVEGAAQAERYRKEEQQAARQAADERLAAEVREMEKRREEMDRKANQQLAAVRRDAGRVKQMVDNIEKIKSDPATLSVLKEEVAQARALLRGVANINNLPPSARAKLEAKTPQDIADAKLLVQAAIAAQL